MTIAYRMASGDDLTAIDRVFRSSFRDTFGHLYRPDNLAAFLAKFSSEAWRSEFVDPRYRFRVAESDGQVVGFVKLGPRELPVHTEAPAIELRQIYILTDHHGRGIAAQLMDWAIAEARRQGAQELYLTVYTDNERARRVYNRYGFEEVGPYAFMVGAQADEDIIMRLAL